MMDATEYTDEMRGYDFHDNDRVTYEGKGVFSTELFSRKAIERINNHNQSQPMFLYVAFQAPHGPVMTPPNKYIRSYDGRRIDRRRINMFSTITALDTAVGEIYDALKKSGMYENSVFIFSTDNGGAVENAPLKGVKEQLFEGGVRGVGFVNSPLLRTTGYDHNKYIYITDWFKTILNLAGEGIKVPHNVDSYDVWDTISRKTKSPRNEIVLNIDQDPYFGLWSAAIIQRKAADSCKIQLYKIDKDPSERTNMAGKMKKREGLMREAIMKHFLFMQEADWPRQSVEKAGFPSNFGGLVSTGWCEAKY